MTRLHYSNRTEALLQRLAADVAAHRRDRGPWVPVTLVIPNRNVQLWLQQGLADALGIAANLRFLFLDQLWRESLPEQQPPLRLLDRPAIQGRLLALFEDGALMAETGFAAYLEGDPDGRRAVQLSGRLARLYEEYLLSRPDWMSAWEQGRSAVSDPREAPQRRLWQALKAGLRGAPDRWLSLADYFASEAMTRGRFPERIFAFGLSQMARAYHDGFRRLGSLRPVDLYVLNPCGEYWEDVRGPREGGEGEDPYGLLLEEHLGLQRWGRPGRENIRLLNDLVDCDFEDHFREPEEDTLLARLQADLLHRAPTLPADPFLPVDGSLRVCAAASPRREAEAVASAIWEQVASGGLRFSDVAVIVPPSQKEAYLDHLRAAFEACHRLPWVAGDEGSRRMAELADGAERLLQLPLSEFTRAEVLALVDHPALAARYPDLEGDWASLCERLGVVRGLEGTAGSGDLWTWTMAARRLALGAVLPPGELDLEGRLSDPVAPPEGADAFLARVEGLLADARWLRDQRLSPSAWALALGRFLGGHLGDGDADAAPLARLQRALQSIESLEVPGLPAPRLSCAAALDLAREALAGLRMDAATLGQGVMVASYAPMRALPFQALFLMGLGEGVFPGQDVRNPLDLRSAARRPGDVARAEQDRYLFLESLLCARRHLHLSYVRRDASDGTALEPSPLLEDLRGLVEALAGPEGWRALVRVPPVDRHDPSAFAPGAPPEFNPEAQREARAAEAGFSFRRAVAPGEAPLGELELAPEARAALATLVRQVPAPEAAGGPPDRLRIRFQELKAWLCDPLQGGAAVRLGLRGEDEEREAAAEREEEPFETPFLARRAWIQTAFWETRTGADPDEALARGWRRRLAAAEAPLGTFAVAERAWARATLTGWLSLAPPEVPRVVRFGLPGLEGLPAEDRDPFRWVLETGGRALRVDLEGATPPLVPGGFLLLSDRKPPGEGKPPEEADGRALLSVWVAHVALRARGFPSPDRVWVLSLHQGQARRWAFPLPDWTPEAAEERLRTWCEDLLAGDPGPLPVEALLAGTADLEDWIQKKRDQPGAWFSSLGGPVPEAAERPPAPDWADRAERRLGAFLRACRGGEAIP